jgi:hypothetical protein
VDGHLRLKAALKLGIREVPVILCDEWTLAQVKAFRLLVNRSVTWAEWDEELLAVEFGELKGLDFNLALTGFAPGEVQACLAQLEWKTAAPTEEDAVPPVPSLPVTPIGTGRTCRPTQGPISPIRLSRFRLRRCHSAPTAQITSGGRIHSCCPIVIVGGGEGPGAKRE